MAELIVVGFDAMGRAAELLDQIEMLAPNVTMKFEETLVG